MREELDRHLVQLTGIVAGMGEQADGMLGRALHAMAAEDRTALQEVVADDAALDRAYDQIQHGVLAAVALHGPVGRDLRQLTGLLYVSLHAERMADYAAGVARTCLHAADDRPDPDLREQLVEMGELARGVGRQAVTAFTTADAELALATGHLDDAVDRLNVGIFQRLVRLAADEEDRLAWATRMIQLTRQLERYADHAVDIADQALFVATGRTRPRSNPPTQ